MPPRSSVDTAGLNERIEYGGIINKLKKGRDISPRLYDFIQKIKRNCEAAMKLPRKSKDFETLQNDIRIDSGMLLSRFEETHGEGGLCDTLINSTKAMLELRLKIEYGDYLAVNCATLKENRFQGYLWKNGMGKAFDWIKVAELLFEESTSMEEWAKAPKGSKPKPPTPWLQDLERAALELGTSKDQLAFEIQYYAQRNQYCHRGIKHLLDDCDFQALAKRILADRKALRRLYIDHEDDAMNMRSALDRFQEKWFTVIDEGPPFTYFVSQEGVLKYHRKKEAAATVACVEASAAAAANP